MEKTTHKPQQAAKNEKGEDNKRHDKKSSTYQEALDEANEQSFPASDPIAPGAAEKAGRQISTPKDDKDWVPKRDSEPKKETDSKKAPHSKKD